MHRKPGGRAQPPDGVNRSQSRRRYASRERDPEATLTIRDQVLAFLLKRGTQWLCDACVGDHLGFTRRQVCRAAQALIRQGRILRARTRCAGCCTDNRVSMAV
ncbi:hypothetical protein ACBY01_16220 [Sphingomonas sp. ac-8]|uniref:hypothetical protein n=1 Tax=Sphingomonas sp. ac-8 TaxID=3242977 RepID=UPI003A8035D1